MKVNGNFLFFFIYILVVWLILLHVVRKSLEKYHFIDKPFNLLAIAAALEVLQAMRRQGVTFNKDTLTLAFGTCYKQVMFLIICLCCYNPRVSICGLLCMLMLLLIVLFYLVRITKSPIRSAHP